MPMGADLFEVSYDTFPDLHSRVRLGGRHIITRALSAGVSMSRGSRDEGMMTVPMGNVRFLQADDSTPGVKEGDRIEIMRTGAGETTYRAFRAASKLTLGGAVRIDIEEEF